MSSLSRPGTLIFRIVLDGNFYIMNDTLYMESGKIFEGLLSTPVDFVMEMPSTTVSYDTLIKIVDTT